MMDKSFIIRLQKALGVTADGIVGKVTLTELFKKCGAKADRAKLLGEAANIHFRTFGILDHPLALAHFMGQAIHETGSFTYLEEIASGKAYEGRKDLGNTVPGYGVRYKGRGIFQLTGYSNYVLYSKKLGIDFVKYPAKAAEADISLLIACNYWNDRKIGALALKDDYRGVTKKINGGYNHYDERVIATNKVKKMLGLTIPEAA